MAQSWVPNINGIAGLSAIGSYSQTTDADGAALYTVWFQFTCLRTAMSGLAADIPLQIGGLPLSPGTGVVFVGPVGSVNGVNYPAGYGQISVTASSESGSLEMGLVLSGSGLPSVPATTSDLAPQSGPAGRGNPGNFFQITGSITFHG